jgi:hypothetical protein
MLTRLYIFGAFLLDQTFQNAVLDAIVDYVKSCMAGGGDIISPSHMFPSPSNVKTIYEGTAKGDPARRLLADFYVHYADGTWVSVEDPASLRGTEFLEEVVPVLVTQWAKPGGAKPWERAGAYHVAAEVTAEVVTAAEVTTSARSMPERPRGRRGSGWHRRSNARVDSGERDAA